MFFKRLFAKRGMFEAYKMFSAGHLYLIIVSVCFIGFAVYKSIDMDRERVLKTVRRCSKILWVLEITKIIFNLCIGNAADFNSYLPLYFCSIPLYCTVLSGYSKGVLKRISDVFLVVGGIVGGVAYILSPNTTAGTYPVFHFITIQSYILHSIMIYIGILFVATGYVELKMRDMIGYSMMVVAFSVTAYTVNHFLGTNLMFVSKTFPNTAIDIVYRFNPRMYPVSITFLQAVPPFFVVFFLSKVRAYILSRKRKDALNN